MRMAVVVGACAYHGHSGVHGPEEPGIRGVTAVVRHLQHDRGDRVLVLHEVPLGGNLRVTREQYDGNAAEQDPEHQRVVVR